MDNFLRPLYGHIRDIERVALVFKDGVAYDPAKLVQAANGTLGLR